MTRLAFKRMRAGLYRAELADGTVADVEYVTTDYGDSGWVWWHNNNRADFPVDTKWYATELLESYLESLA